MSQLCVGHLEVRSVIDVPDQEWEATYVIPDATPSELLDETYVPLETFNPKTGCLRLQFGGFLVSGADKSILVDSGVGQGKDRIAVHREWHRREDSVLLDSLREHGYAPEDIDVVVTTHAHADHVGWLTIREGDSWVPTFANAEHIFARQELSHWLTAVESNPGVNRGSTLDSIVPLLNAAKVTQVEDGFEVTSGVTLHLYPGHTPGNAAVWLESQGQSAVICGDIVHHPIQLKHPEWSSRFCLDGHSSADGRRQLLDEVCDRNAYLLPSHFRLGPSRIIRSGDHYARVEDDGHDALRDVP